MPPQHARRAAWATALLLLLAPGSSRAEIPAGTFIIEIGGNPSIWLDVNEGENAFCEGFAEGFGGTLQACEFSMLVDAKGKLTGSVEMQAANGNGFVGLEGPIKGKLKGDGQTGLTVLGFSLKLSGYVSPISLMKPIFGNVTPLVLPLPGSNATSVSASATFDGQIDGAGALTGEWSSKFCSKAAGCLNETQTPSPEMLDGGGWALVVEIDDLGSGKLGGSGNAVLGDGTQCPYAISGKYSPKTDVASLKLSPSNAACSGTSISMKDARRAARLTAQMKYKIFGQSGDVPIEGTDR